MAKKRLIKKSISIIIMVIFITGNIITPVNAASQTAQNTLAAPGLTDPFGPLDPGGWGRMNPGPGNGISNSANQPAPKKISVNAKALNKLYNTPDHVSATTGAANPKTTDLSLNAQHMPLTIQRTYNGNPDRQGPLGYGWTFNYDQYLQMHQEFKIAEYRGDASIGIYNYTKNNPGQLADSCDEDPLIYYNLDDGYYTPDSQADKSTLTRHSGDSYTVKTKEGTTYHYAGYKAPWRSQRGEAGKLTAVEDRNGNKITLTYDSSGNLTQAEDSYGRKLTFGYHNNLLTTATDPVGRTVNYTYDRNNNLIQVNGLDGAVEYHSYDSSHRLTGYTDALGQTITYTYDGEGKVTQTVRTGGDDQRTYTYHPDQNKTTVSDINGDTTTYTYDQNKNITSIEDPLHNITGYTWDSAGNLTGITEPDGSKTEHQYDTSNNLTKITANGLTASYEYQPEYNQLTRITDPNGKETVYRYDSKGNLTSETNGIGQTTGFAYDSLGKLTEISDPAGHKTSLEYDQNGNLKQITNALGQKTTCSIDQAGRILSLTQPGNRTTTLTYQDSHQPVSVTDPTGKTTQYQYNKKTP